MGGTDDTGLVDTCLRAPLLDVSSRAARDEGRARPKITLPCGSAKFYLTLATIQIKVFFYYPYFDFFRLRFKQMATTIARINKIMQVWRLMYTYIHSVISVTEKMYFVN